MASILILLLKYRVYVTGMLLMHKYITVQIRECIRNKMREEAEVNMASVQRKRLRDFHMKKTKREEGLA